MILFCAALELWLDTPSATEAQLDDDFTCLRAEMQERVRRIVCIRSRISLPAWPQTTADFHDLSGFYQLLRAGAYACITTATDPGQRRTGSSGSKHPPPPDGQLLVEHPRR
jgi:hypothetical protein